MPSIEVDFDLGETLFALTANTRKVMQIDVENPAILHSFSIINSELESTLHGIAVAMDGLQVYIADSNPLINSTLYKFESVPQTSIATVLRIASSDKILFI